MTHRSDKMATKKSARHSDKTATKKPTRFRDSKIYFFLTFLCANLVFCWPICSPEIPPSKYAVGLWLASHIPTAIPSIFCFIMTFIAILHEEPTKKNEPFSPKQTKHGRAGDIIVEFVTVYNIFSSWWFFAWDVIYKSAFADSTENFDPSKPMDIFSAIALLLIVLMTLALPVCFGIFVGLLIYKTSGLDRVFKKKARGVDLERADREGASGEELQSLSVGEKEIDKSAPGLGGDSVKVA